MLVHNCSIKTHYGIFRQESSKEMDVNNEILFTRARDQLMAATIYRDNGSFDMERSVPILLLADFVSNIITPLRASEYSFTQISFHAKLTFSLLLKTRFLTSASGPLTTPKVSL